ncbi:MAG: hypothetical protein PHN92_07160 [Geobacter sp.]|nr:hypothetical protein [Geobacter sp.]
MNTITRLLILLAVLLIPGISQAFNVSGSYSSTEGAVTLHQSEDRVTGSYTNDNGELTGLMFNNIFEGFWIEDGSDRRCATPKNGRYHWGRVTLSFDGNGFSGVWGHCDDKPARSWTGSRSSGRQVTPPSDRGEADPFAINDGTLLEGVWGSTEGDIRFRQQGNRMSGRYTNDNGELVGTVNNDVLRGYWIEDHSNKRCSSPKNGRYFWGRIEFRFSGNSFSGRWGYCDDVLSGSWSGQRK